MNSTRNSSTTQRTVALVAALATGGVAFAACSPQAATSAAPSAAAPTVTQSATATQTTTATSTTTASQQTAAPAAGAAAKTCVNTNLELTHASDPDGTGAGHSGLKLTVKNIGQAACVLPKDTPIELLVQPEAPQQVGAPATFDPKPAQDLTLAPGATASSSVSIAKADSYGDKCQPKQAWALGLAVGSGTLYVVTPVDNVTACANGEVKLMQAKPFQLD